MHDYQRKGFTKYGAFMGRGTDLPKGFEGTLTIREVPIDNGGYDPGGAYWGTGTPLFLLTSDDGRTDYARAANVVLAKALYPAATWTEETDATEADIEDMVSGYLTCAVFTATDEDGDPMDADYTDADFTPEACEQAKRDVTAFAKAHGKALARAIASGHARTSWTRAGHDLWYARNGHGISFSDNWPDDVADTLDKAARKLRDLHVYASEGKLAFE